MRWEIFCYYNGGFYYAAWTAVPGHGQVITNIGSRCNSIFSILVVMFAAWHWVLVAVRGGSVALMMMSALLAMFVTEDLATLIA